MVDPEILPCLVTYARRRGYRVLYYERDMADEDATSVLLREV